MINISILSIGNKPPKPIIQTVDDYANRLKGSNIKLSMIDIKLAQRGASLPYQKAVEDETNRLLAKHPAENKMIMLDRKGKSISSLQLSDKIKNWQLDNQSVSIAIGGPEGFSEDTLKNKADEIWSLSALTMAHPIVKVVLAEQIYRAYAILSGHPYHRGDSFQK